MDEEGLRRNAILASLPGPGLAELASEVEVVPAEVRMQVYQPGSTIDTVYFPLASVFSLVGVTDERVVVEVATVGREGMVGLPIFLGAVTTPHAAFCQVGGPAARLSADGLRQALAGEANGALHDALSRFTQATMAQIAQNVVCNSTHPAIQRAARWLLTTRDRLGSTDFPLTQESSARCWGSGGQPCPIPPGNSRRRV